MLFAYFWIVREPGLGKWEDRSSTAAREPKESPERLLPQVLYARSVKREIVKIVGFCECVSVGKPVFLRFQSYETFWIFKDYLDF